MSAPVTATLALPSRLAGARYEGEWQHGREEGTGTFYAPGRGTYYGSWRGGQMHGKCVYTPDAGPAAVEAPEST